jgi:cytochrome c oxidase subunit 1
MVFMEIAILSVGGPMILGRKRPFTVLSKGGWVLMAVGAVVVNVSVFFAENPDSAPLLTADYPLESSSWFDGAVVLFIAERSSPPCPSSRRCGSSAGRTPASRCP